MLIRGLRRQFSSILSNNPSDIRTVRDSLVRWDCLDQNCSDFSLVPKTALFTCIWRSYKSDVPISRAASEFFPIKTPLLHRSSVFLPRNLHLPWQHVRCMSCSSIELTADKDVVRFSIGKQTERAENPEARRKKSIMSRKAKLNELRLYRLKAKKKMNSPNPEVRIRYKLGKAKRKEEWLIEKLRKYEAPQAPAETYDPEILTEEEKFYLKRTGEKKKHYVPVGRRGVFGGVVLNMHLSLKQRFEQSLEHTCNFIEKLEKELEEYCDYKARFRQENENAAQSLANNS